MKNSILSIVAILSIVVIVMSVFLKYNDNKDNKKENASVQESIVDSFQETVSDKIWVYRYDSSSGDYKFATCGYIDEYTSLVKETDNNLKDAIFGTYMYLGTITGYQNEDRTIDVFQVSLPELSDNFVLTNDNIKLDYSGNKKMIKVDGWIYIDKNQIVAVSPLYNG